jgi:hypothetical protein
MLVIRQTHDKPIHNMNEEVAYQLESGAKGY